MIYNTGTFKIKKSYILCICTFLPLFSLSMQLLLYKIYGIDPNMGSTSIRSLTILTTFISLVMSLLLWLKNIEAIKKLIIIYGIAIFIYISQFILYPENRLIIKDYYFEIIFINLPLLVDSSLIKNKDDEIKALEHISWGISIICILYALVVIINNTFGFYVMSYGYYMFVPACFFSYLYSITEEKKYMLISLFDALLILTFGSRAPIVLWAIYFLCSFVSLKQYNYKKIIAFFVLFLTIIFKDQILLLLIRVLDLLGINSRSISFLVEGQMIGSDSGRTDIYIKSVELIKENILFGGGIGADVRALGGYPHNIFIEVFIHFGIILGMMLIIIMSMITMYKFLHCADKLLFLFYFFVGVLPLMVSGSYLKSFNFAIFCGVLIRSNCWYNQMIPIMKCQPRIR